MSCRMADPTNGDIAAALRELGDLYELDGAIVHRVVAYRTAAKAIRDAPCRSRRWRARAARPSCRARQDAAGEDPGALETGEIPAAVKLRAKFPAGPGRDDATAGPRAQAGAALYEELGIDSLDALREAAEAERLRTLKGFGPKAEETARARSQSHGGRRGPAPGSCSTQRAARRRADRRRAARAPRRRPGRAGRLGAALADSVKDLDIVATATDPEALVEAFARAAADRVGRLLGRGRRAGAHAQGHAGRPAHRRARAVRQPAAALHRVARRTTWRCARRPCGGACTSPSTACSTTRPARRRVRDRGGGLRRLGLAYIEPELRENRGELEAARRRRRGCRS